MFYLADFLRTQAQEAASQITQMDCSEEVREEPRYKGVFAPPQKKKQKTGSWNIKRLLLIKEIQTSQVNESSAFLWTGRCRSLGSLKSFL